MSRAIIPRFRLWKVIATAALLLLLSYACGLNIHGPELYEEPSGFWKFLSDVLQHAAAAVLIAAFVARIVEETSRLRLDAVEDASRKRADSIEANAKATMEAITRAAAERRVRDQEALERERKDVADASLEGVARTIFGTIHSKDVLQETIDSIFSSPLLRENYLNRVQFRRSPDDPGVVIVREVMRYTIFNSSKFMSVHYKPKFGIDDPASTRPHNKILQHFKLTNVQIGKDVFDEAKIESWNDQWVRTSEADSQDLHLLPFGDYEIGPEERLAVQFTYEHAEPIDYEYTTRMFYPTKDVTVAIHNDVGPHFLVFVTALARKGFGKRSYVHAEGTQWEQQIEGVVLPNGGWTLRWSNAEPPSAGPEEAPDGSAGHD
jgi:hypothetical protein